MVRSMLRALLEKEWIKLRLPVLALLGIAVISILNAAIVLRYQMETLGAPDLWNSLIVKQRIFYARHLVFPSLCGIAIGLFQWFPETRKRRLRLLLHLPLPEQISIPFVVGCGIFFTLMVAGLHLLGMAMVFGMRFPFAVVESLVWTFAPRFLSGVVLYCGVTLVLMETSWLRRIAGVALVFGFHEMLTTGGLPGGHVLHFPAYAGVTLLSAIMVYLPAMRAKRGGA